MHHVCESAAGSVKVRVLCPCTVSRYVCVAIALALMAILQMSFAHCLMLRAGSALHDRVFRVVLRGTMAFFDTNPTGAA